jgi:hypothetical protein
MRRLLTVKNRTKRQCRPLISKLLLAINELKASGFPPLISRLLIKEWGHGAG